ncbi:glutathione S-transferase 1-like isoform X1 [Anopheles funestus]|uniref:glutathione S-transferase 1-like isoform X1 n=1 Tax=Anopheles funestus TaxID=62324 RepID=UPI0020C6F094|nr:glutathione S-transferase 1-like isoform X1 [Anopheles funestus]
MTKLVLYTLHLSPPCRAVELTAKALGLELEQKNINLLAGDHLTPEFMKVSFLGIRECLFLIHHIQLNVRSLQLNPQHTIPVLDDDGTIITESHAIMIYLVTKYGKDDTLYPKDPVQQARVNAALHFESGVLFARMRFIFERILFYGKSDIPEDRVEYVQKSYRLLEDTLKDDFVAGSKMTIADFSCISTISSIMGVVPLEQSEHPRIYEWIDRLKQLPYYEEANGGGGTDLGKFVLAKKEENAKA